MKNKNNKNAEQGHHDDCEDCRREKKQNQALISIYERLQAVDNHSKILRKSLDKHKDDCLGTTQKFKQLSVRLKQLPKQSKADIELKNLGYEFAETLMEQIVKRKLQHDNEFLLRSSTKTNPPVPVRYANKEKLTINRSFSLNPRHQPQNRNLDFQNTQNSMTRSKIIQQQDSDFLRRFAIPSQKMSTIRQPDQTKTTAFFENVEKDKPKIDGLNLWLYSADFNKSLEEQLYETRKSHRITVRNSSRLKGSTVLPTIKSTRHKF